MRRFVSLLLVLTLTACAGEEGQRAEDLLERAEASQAALSSMAYSVGITMAAEGQRFTIGMNGAAVLKGENAGDQWLRVTMPELTPGEGTLVVRDGVMTFSMFGTTERMELPADATANREALGALASLALAKCVEKVRVDDGKSFHDEPATQIAGVVDTGCVLEAVSGLSELGKLGGQQLDLDELGAQLGDVHATLFISERSGLLVGGVLSLEVEEDGESVAVDVSYRLKSANKPVRFPG